MDNLRYRYYPNSNRLQRVDDYVTLNTMVDDIKDQNGNNYTYNDLGQLVSNAQDAISYTYNTAGLVTAIHNTLTGNPVVKFMYDDKGKRLKKEFYINGQLNYTDYYVRDASGSPMAIYRNSTLKENPIYGGNRLGIHYREDNSDVYQLTDHLGNVRAVVTNQGGNTLAVISKADYYPGGMPMPNRNIVGDYRYNYQGQELDKETGKIAFELRLYDPRINRWLTTDPKKEFHNPYLGMGNNWVNLIDPDGGSAASPQDDYKLNKDGSIELVRVTDDNFDRLFDSEGVQIGTVNKGFLSDGINIQNNGLFLDVLNKKDFHSYIGFIDDLSVHIIKEIGGLFLEDNKNFDNIFITPYVKSLPKSAVSTVNWLNNGNHKISQQMYKIGTNFHKANGWFHTHPDIMNGGGYSRPSQGDINTTKTLGVPGVIIGGWGGTGLINTDGTYERWGQ